MNQAHANFRVDEGTSFTLGRLPRIEFGTGSMARVPAIVAGHGRRVLLVTGGRSFAASGHELALETGLREVGVTMVGRLIISSEPSPSAIDEALVAHRGSEVHVVLGVGGGSVLDAGKAIAGLLRTATSVRDHLEGFEAQLPYPGPSAPFVAVPTTAGTGSEVTRNAVISERGAGGFKRSFRDERLVPTDAIVDPDLLAGAPPALIAANGMDAVAQLLESYVSLRASPLTDSLALAGLAAAGESLLAWQAAPDGPDAPAARAGMAYAALLSGICLSHAGLGAPHGLAAALGAQLPIPHGAACGAVLPHAVAATIAALETRQPTSPALARFATLGRLLGPPANQTDLASDEAARAALVATLRAWVDALAIPRLAVYDLSTADIPTLVVGSRGSSMRTNPIVLEDAELADILTRSL